MPSFSKKIFSGTLPLLISKYLTSAIFIIFLAEIARVLGPNTQGIFLLVTSTLIPLVVTISSFGLDQYLIREISKKIPDSKNLITNITILKIFASIFSYIILYILFICIPLSENVKFLTWIAIPFSLFSVLSDMFEDLLQAHQRFSLIALISILQKSILTVGGIVLISLNMSIQEIIYLFVFSSFFRFVLNFIFTFNYYQRAPVRIDCNIMVESIKTSSPLFLSILFGTIYYYVDYIMLEIFKSASSVGFYGSAVKINEFLLFTPIIFTSVVFPILTNLYKYNFEKFIDVYRKSIKLLTLIAIIIFIILDGIAIYIFPMIYPEDYIVSAYIFKILLFALPFHFCNAQFAKTIFIIGKQKYLPIFSFIVTLLNICLNLILIPRYDYYGAAIATVLSEIAGAIAGIYLIHRFMKERYPAKEMFKPLVILALSLLFGFITGKFLFNHEWINFILTFIYFILISLVTGSISYSEIKKSINDILGI